MTPGVSSSAHEGRRNLTDAQETSQWMGGTEVPEMILKDLLGILPLTSELGFSWSWIPYQLYILICHAGKIKQISNQPATLFIVTGENFGPVLIVNATMYDGCLEKQCVSMGIPVVSHTDKQPVFVTALKLVKNQLLASWKNGVAPFHDKTPRYKPEPNHEDLPSQPSEPTFRICSMVDGTLILPRDVRGEFLTDVVRSPEWRKILQEFDRCFSTASQPSPDEGTSAAAEGGEAAAAAADQTAFQWPSATAAAEWHATWDSKVKAKFAWSPELTGYLVEKESASEDNLPDFHLYVEAMSADVSVFPEDVFLTYGSGTWLTGAKVANFVENAPSNHRGVGCQLETDLVPVVLEAWKSILNSQYYLNV